METELELQTLRMRDKVEQLLQELSAERGLTDSLRAEREQLLIELNTLRANPPAGWKPDVVLVQTVLQTADVQRLMTNPTSGNLAAIAAAICRVSMASNAA